MSHKEKICNTALTSHVEFCHEQHSYTPLVVSKHLWEKLPEKTGIKNLIKEELDQKIIDRQNVLKETSRKVEMELKETIDNALDKSCKKIDASTQKGLNISMQDFKHSTFRAIDEELEQKLKQSYKEAVQEIINDSKGVLDLNNPQKAIEFKENEIAKMISDVPEEKMVYQPIPLHQTYELEGLGLFFKESVCYRPEGFTYAPCGKEVTIMPGEEIKESNVLTTTIKEEDSENTTITQSITSTDKEEEVNTFTESYENTLEKETDIKLSKESSFKIKIPLKVVNLDLSSSTSGAIDFNKIIKEVNKSSHTNTRTRFNEVIRKLTIESIQKSSRSLTSTNEYTHNRIWKNDTSTPQTYVKRKSYCKTSVLHRRHNVQMAWQGCIDNPARDLCTLDTIEERHATDIQAIRDKWQQATAPAEFGPRPKGKKVCTSPFRDYNHPLHTGVSKFRQDFQYTIPNGWSYDHNSASVNILSNSSGVEEKLVYTQPSAGARGGVSFNAAVILDNRWGKREEVVFSVCFNIVPDTAIVWDTKVQAWRDEETQKEIDAFIAKHIEELTQYLATDQARASVERRIMEDFFGVTVIEDCCKLISRLRKLFDFDSMGYSLLPTWNEFGEGCQKAFPVNLYTAKCLHFFLPMQSGKEREALQLLASINAIPWSIQLIPQILAYVQQVQNMRNTLYNRIFDPTGWNIKFDQPKGYDMTPYDTSNTDWDAAHESDLNFELLGAFTINVPCGERIDTRPLLCE